MFINNIRYALKAIFNNKVVTILLIIQLSISFVFFIQYLNLYKEISYKTDLALKQYDTSNVYVITKDTNIHDAVKQELQKKSLNELNQIQKQMESFFDNSAQFDYLISRDNITSMPLNEKTSNFDFKESDIRVRNIDGVYKEFSIVEVPSYTINETYLERFGLSVKEGRTFDSEDFKIDGFAQSIPIIVGNKWADYYNVGDVISIYNFIKNDYVYMEIVGVLPKDTKLFMHEYTSTDLINDINKIVILPNVKNNVYEQKYKEYMHMLGIPYNEVDMEIEKILSMLDALLIFEDGTSMEEARIIVNDGLNALGVNNIKIETISDRFESQKISAQKTMLQNQFIFIMLFIFSFIGITISFVVSVNMRLKEFAIHILNGARKIDIGMRIFLELLIITTVSMLIAIIYTNACLYVEYINAPIIENIVYSRPSYILPSIEVLITIIILAVISSLMPVLRLKNADINDVIKGDE